MEIPEGVKLICLDVDGTLVVTKSGETFRKTADDWVWMDGRIEKCKQLRADGIQLALATNQAGVAFPWSRFTEAEMQREIEIVARLIDAGYIGVCYSSPNAKALPQYHNPADNRRKPGPGMILEAMLHYGVMAAETIMVGDRSDDEGAAKAAGVRFIHADEFFK
jgi:D-glycero-D-manno-heptose 1,7-bisphosphate phosphatase